MKNKKGFTLVELLAVIVILAILATAAFTLVLPQIEKSRKKSFISEVANIIDSAELYFLDNPTKTQVSIGDLKNLIKNYDEEKQGCVKAPTTDASGNATTGYTVYFTNGDYQTLGATTFHKIEDLKDNDGNPTNKVVSTSTEGAGTIEDCTTQ